MPITAKPCTSHVLSSCICNKIGSRVNSVLKPVGTSLHNVKVWLNFQTSETVQVLCYDGRVSPGGGSGHLGLSVIDYLRYLWTSLISRLEVQFPVGPISFFALHLICWVSIPCLVCCWFSPHHFCMALVVYSAD